MKKKIFVLIIIVAIVVIAILANINLDTQEQQTSSDALKFKEEYEAYNNLKTTEGYDYLNLKISKNNIVEYVSIKQTLEILKSKSGILFLGAPNDLWTRNMVNVLLNAATSASVETIYYLNVNDIEDNKYYEELLEQIGEITQEDEIKIPLVIFVQEGKTMNYHYLTVDSQTEASIALSDEQIEELYNIYIDYIIELQDSTCDDSC